MSDKILAWHFLSGPHWTAYGGYKVEVGKTYTHEGRLVPCESGLHASERADDAASFRRGVVVTRVECGGEVVRHHAKFVCRERKALWGYDATEELRAHARWCALEVAHLWKMPDMVRAYLETGEESLRERARFAANAYADAADVTYATGAAAYAAAYAAAADAADAADAAANAANVAAWKDFLDRANDHLEALLTEGAKKRGLL